MKTNTHAIVKPIPSEYVKCRPSLAKESRHEMSQSCLPSSASGFLQLLSLAGVLLMPACAHFFGVFAIRFFSFARHQLSTEMHEISKEAKEATQIRGIREEEE